MATPQGLSALRTDFETATNTLAEMMNSDEAPTSRIDTGLAQADSNFTTLQQQMVELDAKLQRANVNGCS